ncbi:MAG: 3-phosphoshikimate 1-carboxyvinyltransferase [Anaerolineae bacterium]|nr:3-phosphoshikimate 1-carboxyvinyltransferase [Anaerolineae bacterium]
MESLTITAGQPLRGHTRVPGDKSLSHRAVLLGALAAGVSQVRGWLAAGDTEATLAATRRLGVPIERHDTHTLTIHGGTLHAPTEPLNFVNAGTGIRLAAGILAGQPFRSVLDGTEQLRRRPMRRIIAPLHLMGANISGSQDRAPLTIEPAALRGIRYELPEASAQVKSAVLLAGLFAQGVTEVIQPGPARDHTERMLLAMGANLVVEGNHARLTPGQPLQPVAMTVPGDFSSAAFLIVAGLVTPDSDLTITGVNLNDTRTGLLDVLLEMGAKLTVTPTGLEAGEPVGDIRVQTSDLKGVTVGGGLVVRMIDEFPVFMVAALCASGTTLVQDAKELRVKETDRIAVMAGELRKMGAVIEERDDGFRLVGPQTLTGAAVEGHDDHRVAMSMTVAGLIAAGESVVHDAKCAGDSFPGFAPTMAALGAAVTQQPQL